MRSSVNSWSQLLLPEKGRFWLWLVLFHMLASAGVGAALPLLTQKFYADFTGEGWGPFYVMAGLFLVEYVNRLFYQVSSHKYIQHLLGETRERTFALWLRSPLKLRRKGKDHDDFPLGEVLARVMSDTEAVRELVSSGAFGIFIDLVFILAALVGFLTMDAGVGTGLLALEVLACVLLVWGSRKMGELFMSVRQVTGVVSRVVADVTNGLRELAFTPHRKYASARGEKVFDDFLQKQLKANVWDAGYYSAAESLYPILLALVLAFFPGGQAGRVALLAVLIDLIQKSITPIKEVAGKISSIQRSRTGLVRIHEFQTLFGETPPVAPGSAGEVQDFHVELHHFAHPPREGETPFELHELRLQGRQGELVGIVGPSGCGKSTFLRLLTGQHGAFDGEVRFNGERWDMNDPAGLLKLSRHVSLVSQDSHVFSASVEFNVALAEGEATFPAFWAQAQTALPYLRKWGVGPETVLSPKGLSLGQKQLLSGLRACYLHKPVVLFDEVSSGLDPELERALRDLVLFVQRRCLTLIVTHRLETIMGANRLLLMERGRVVDAGSAAELTARSAAFREFTAHLREG